MIIIVSGLPGAGKSLLVEMLANEFRLKKVFASHILRNLIEGKEFDLNKTEKSTGFFESEDGVKATLTRAKNKEFDKKLDKMLLDLISKEDNLIVDSRTMPWLSKKGFKIWVQASEYVRAHRTAERDKIEFEDAKEKIIERLENDKKIYAELYKFKFAEDLKPFDLILDTGSLNKKEMFEKAKNAVKEYMEKENSKEK